MRTTHNGSPKRRCRIVGHVIVRIVNKKLRAAKYSDQPVELNKEPGFFEAFADGGIGRLLIGVDPSAGEGPETHFSISTQ